MIIDMDQTDPVGELVVYPDFAGESVPKAQPVVETVVIYGTSTTGQSIGGTPDAKE